MVAREDFVTKTDLEKSLGKFKEEIIHEFHVASERVEDQLKLFAELQSKTIQRYDRIEKGKRTPAHRDSCIN
jgi:hypothetical protein